MKIKSLLASFLLLAPLSQAGAVNIFVASVNAPIKLVSSHTLVASGEAKIGWFTGEQPSGHIAGPLSEVAGRMFFLGSGGNAGTGTISITNGATSGQITGFNPSATGDTSYQNRQLFVLLLDAYVPVLANASDTVNWALVMAPKTLSAQWNTGVASNGVKVLGTSAPGISALFGKLQIDGIFQNATTGIGLVPYIPEPSSTLFLGVAGLLGLRRRRG